MLLGCSRKIIPRTNLMSILYTFMYNRNERKKKKTDISKFVSRDVRKCNYVLRQGIKFWM